MPTINIRCSKEVRDFLRESAKREGKTLSAALREAAGKEAHKILETYRREDAPVSANKETD